MKAIKYMLLFLFNLFLDLSILSRYNFFGYIPSITIPIIIILSIYNDDEKIVYYAIIQGIFQDVAFIGLLGVNTLIYYLISYYVYTNNYKKNYSYLYANISLLIALISKNIISILFNILLNIKDISSVFLFSYKELLSELFISFIILLIIYAVGYHFRKTKIREYI